MDLVYYLSISFSILLVLKLFFKQNQNLPPTPPALPILGHIHLLKIPLYRSLQALSAKYGPILFLKLGFQNVLLVSSPSFVEESFINNDVVFANRPHCLVGEYIGYDYTAVNWAPYGKHWRNLRRVTATEIFSSNSLSVSSNIRNQEVKAMINQLFRKSFTKDGNEYHKLNLNLLFFEVTFNMMMRMVNGSLCFREEMDIEEKKKLRELLKELFLPMMPMGMDDFFPFLKWLGVSRSEKKLTTLKRRRDEFLQTVIEEQREMGNKSSSTSGKTVVGALLSLQEAEPDYYTDKTIRGVVGVMFTAGTDTSSLTLEWAMSLLLNHPEVAKRAREEINTQVEHGRLLDESDLQNLPYLHCIINETLRLYPPGPLLVPRVSSEDCNVAGYEIPRGTILLVNAYYVQRDSKVWVDPNCFKPERFEGKEAEKGFKYLPFGLGRRVCPGVALAVRVMCLLLGTLIQCFEWERIGEEEVDMTEPSDSVGITMPRIQPLEAMYKPRLTMLNYLSTLST